MLERALEMRELASIIEFCPVVLHRQVQFYQEYKDKFRNIYRERVAEYFWLPPSKRAASVAQSLLAVPALCSNPELQGSGEP